MYHIDDGATRRRTRNACFRDRRADYTEDIYFFLRIRTFILKTIFLTRKVFVYAQTSCQQLRSSNPMPYDSDLSALPLSYPQVLPSFISAVIVYGDQISEL